MKRIIAIASSLAVLLSAASCDFLDIRTEASLPSTGIDYSKSENMFMPVSAAYAQMRAGHGFNYLCLAEIPSDDADKGSESSDSATAIEMDGYKFTPNNGLLNSVWTEFFNMVSAANNAIEQMPRFAAAQTTEENIFLSRQYACEAKLIRAYAYFQLTRLFGEVPLVDRTMSAEELGNNPALSSDELYEFMCRDLDDAIDTLPESYGKGWGCRYTKYTAMGLKAKVALYHGDWAEAAKQADATIASNRFKLMDDFRYVFSVEGEGCQESIMEIESSDMGMSSGSAPYLDYAYIQGPRNNKPSNMQGWGFNVPNDNLISFLKERGDDIRYAATILERGTTTPEGDYILETCTNPYYNGKVYTPSAYNDWSYNGYGFDHNVRVIRYSDILLIYAEALVNGAPAGTCGYSADFALNMVRARAGLAPVSATIDSILDERRAEFAMEENRLFDLKRTGRAAGTIKGFVSPKHDYYPVPANQLQLNTALSQRAGW